MEHKEKQLCKLKSKLKWGSVPSWFAARFCLSRAHYTFQVPPSLRWIGATAGGSPRKPQGEQGHAPSYGANVKIEDLHVAQWLQELHIVPFRSDSADKTDAQLTWNRVLLASVLCRDLCNSNGCKKRERAQPNRKLKYGQFVCLFANVQQQTSNSILDLPTGCVNDTVRVQKGKLNASDWKWNCSFLSGKTRKKSDSTLRILFPTNLSAQLKR